VLSSTHDNKQLAHSVQTSESTAINQSNIYAGDTLQASYRLRQALGGLDTGYLFERIPEIRLGYKGGYEKYLP
jgi:hypothetical protein